MRRILAIGWILTLPLPAHAGTSFSTSAMGFANSTKQGGQGAQGSTILTETKLQYSGSWWGLGAFFQFDMQGEHEKDMAAGPKLELNWNPFFIEAGYAILMQRAYTDRSIAKQTGNGYFLGLGARFALGAAPAGPAGSAGFFLEFSYKHRVQNIRKQDSTTLGEPIVQTDDYPLFGLGFRF